MSKDKMKEDFKEKQFICLIVIIFKLVRILTKLYIRWNVTTSPVLNSNTSSIILVKLLIFFLQRRLHKKDEEHCPPQLAVSAQVALQLDEKELLRRRKEQDAACKLHKICNTIKHWLYNSITCLLRDVCNDYCISTAVEAVLLHDGKVWGLFESKHVAFSDRKAKLYYTVLSILGTLVVKLNKVIRFAIGEENIKGIRLLVRLQAKAKIICLHQVLANFEEFKCLFAQKIFSWKRSFGAVGKGKGKKMPRDLKKSLLRRWIKPHVLNDSFLNSLQSFTYVFMVRNQNTNGNEQMERRTDSFNNVYLTGGRDARMDDSPLVVAVPPRHRRRLSRKRCISHNDASEIEQPINISWHVKGSCQQTKQPHAKLIQKEPCKAPRRRSKSQSDVMDDLPEPQKLASIRPKVKENIKELEGNFLAFTEEEHAHLNSDELFWSGKSGYADLSRYQIEAPEQTDCPQCSRLMLSAFHLPSHQLLGQLKSDGKSLDVNLSDLIGLQLERQEAAAYSDERPCYQYSVVHGENTMIKRFLTCLFHGHLEQNCGILLKDELGNIARIKGHFREGHEYRMLKVLGKGTYGIVQLCEIITSLGNGFEFVIKEIKADAFNEEEIEIPLEHGNGCQQILEIYGIIRRGDKILLVMEYARGGTLSSLKVGRDITFKDFITVTFNLLGGIQYLHNAGICLYDIKGENIVLRRLNDPNSVAFIDWGSIKYLDPNIQNRNFNNGTRKYYPPERRMDIKAGHLQSHDLWTLGCALYTSLHGQRIFEKTQYECHLRNRSFDHLISTKSNVIEKELSCIDQTVHVLCPSMVDLLCGLLQMEPRGRITASEALSHRLFHSNAFGHTWGISRDLNSFSWIYNTGEINISEDSNELAKVLVTWDSVILFTTFVSKGTSVRKFIQDKNFNYQIQPYIQSSSGYYLKEKTTRRNALDIVDDIELELILVN